MRRAIIALLLVCGAAFAQQKQSAKPASVNLYELELRNGVYYSKENNKPYTGEFVESNDDCADCDYDYYETGNMKNGKRHGEVRWVSVDSVVSNYKDGKLQGEMKLFDRNGNLKSVKNYKDSIPNGEWKYFDKNGKLREVRNYKGGKRQKEQKSFDENGNLIKSAPSNTPSILTDSRDGKKYKYVKIGSQTWMAENLNYNANGSKCYEDKESNCQKYGRLYDWETAMKSCPSGWHLPNNKEWEELVDFAGSIWELVGAKLKAKSGWNGGGNGTDDYGFSALPGGFGLHGSFSNVGDFGNWWSANERNSSNIDTSDIFYHYNYVDWHDNLGILRSIRCLKD